MTAALRTGAVIIAAASVALLVMSSRHVPLVALWSAVFVYVLGFAMLIPMAHALALEPAGDAAGLASSLLGALPTLLAAGGSAIAASSVFASAYRAICLTMFGAGMACLVVVFVGTRGRRGEDGDPPAVENEIDCARPPAVLVTAAANSALRTQRSNAVTLPGGRGRRSVGAASDPRRS